MKRTQNTIQSVLESYPPEPRYLLALLQDIQEQDHYISVEAMQVVAGYLDVPESRVYSVATFYTALSLVPLGRHVIKVCSGTACHLRGAPVIVEAFEKELGIKNGETTPDRMFTIQTVNCLGACAMAPVVMIDDEVYGKMTAVRVPEIIEGVRASDSE